MGRQAERQREVGTEEEDRSWEKGSSQGRRARQEERRAEEGEQRRAGFSSGLHRACALGPESDGTFA